MNTLHMIRSFGYHPIVRIIFGTLAIITSVFTIKEWITKPILNQIFANDLLTKTVVPILSTGVMIGVYYLLMRYYEKRGFHDFGRKNALKETWNGLLIGMTPILTAVALMYGLGYYQVVDVNNFWVFLPSATFILGGVVLEELVFRGIVFKVIENWKGSTIALIASAIIFQIPHFMNPHEDVLPALLGTLFGIVTALMYMHTRQLWLPIAFHYAWNLMQPIMGTTLSGISEFEELLIVQIEGPELITGSQFGVEDSLVILISLSILAIYYIRKLTQQGNWVKVSKRSF